MKRIAFAFVSVVLAAAVAAPASAQQQNKAQQACLNTVVKTARKISGTVLKDASQCIRKGAGGSLPMGETAAHCVIGDLGGKVAKARTKLDAAALASCATAPDFGFLDATTAADAYVSDNEALTDDGFGIDLDATLVASDSADPAGRCSATLPAAWRKLEDAMHRAVETCLKDGLRAGTVTGIAGYETCLDSLVADTRGRVAKAVALVQSKLTTKCPSGNLSTMFPGLPAICSLYGSSTDAAGIAVCGRDRLECRVCRIFNFAYGLDRDCDLFDDSTANASCPDCGNGTIDSGEDCDDMNIVSGDGCTSLCRDESCGDGVVNDNGAEQCDDGGANSDTTPGACRLNCENPTCGDGVTDAGLGEECDDGNLDENDGCTSLCTSCGNGTTAPTELCDDGNNLGGDCCSASCTFEAYASPCVDAPSGECTAPGCDGAGACLELPANAGTPCDDGDECSNGSECQAGTCTTTSYVVTGTACRWAVVGNPGGGNERRMEITQGATSSGPWCGNYGRFGTSVVMGDDIVTTLGDGTTPGAEFDSSTNIDAASVYTNNARVSGIAAVNLPGLMATTTIAPGLVVNKTPAPTKYDTTGTDPLVADCQAAQLAISTSTAGLLNALSANLTLPGTWGSILTGESRTAVAPNPGSVNVIDVANITGANTGVTLNFDGGGDPDTVIILRVANKLETKIGWTWNLTNGMSPDHFLIYGQGTSNTDCYIGQDNVGAGTIFCPNARIQLKLNTQWTGALYGGGTSVTAIDVGDNVDLIHQRFTGF